MDNQPVVHAAATVNQSNSTAAPNSPRKILLACPPFQHPHLASLSVSHLSTLLRGWGIPCEEAYFHFDLLELCGEKTYLAAVERRKGNIAELLFAEALHGHLDAPYQESLAVNFGDAKARSALTTKYAKRCIQRILEVNPDIVGFTTSYNQLIASLFLAKKLKEQSNIPVVLGGSACGDTMGKQILKSYPFLDYVISGFGGKALKDLCLEPLPKNKFIEVLNPPNISNDPIPDYRPFLAEADEYSPLESDISLLYQSSQGCWWGEKKHCSFCGLHRSQLSYEAKSSDKVISDLRTLYERHQKNILTTDCIASPKHIRNVFPKLEQFDRQPWIFYELKGNVTEQRVRSMARARIVVQVGIESLSSRVLKLLNKGATTLTWMALLKWCREYKLQVEWNFLYAIPNEQLSDYQTQIELMENIPHLPPPRVTSPIHVDRYSPYFDDFAAHGFSKIEPAPEYRAAHPQMSNKELENIAYHFIGHGGTCSEQYLEQLDAAVSKWKQRFKDGDGLYLDPQMGLYRKTNEQEEILPIDSLTAQIIGASHQITPTKKIIQLTGCSENDLQEMADSHLLYIENNKLVNLAVRTKTPK